MKSKEGSNTSIKFLMVSIIATTNITTSIGEII
jgi:hypothetical protein